MTLSCSPDVAQTIVNEKDAGKIAARQTDHKTQYLLAQNIVNR